MATQAILYSKIVKRQKGFQKVFKSIWITIIAEIKLRKSREHTHTKQIYNNLRTTRTLT